MIIVTAEKINDKIKEDYEKLLMTASESSRAVFKLLGE